MTEEQSAVVREVFRAMFASGAHIETEEQAGNFAATYHLNNSRAGKAFRAWRDLRDAVRARWREVVRPCPACKRPHDSHYIPPQRVPMTSRCACCCQG